MNSQQQIVLEGSPSVEPTTLLQPKVIIISENGGDLFGNDIRETKIGERNIIEDRTRIKNSIIGRENLIGIQCVIEKVSNC
jgi:NDP-sugar pyrophosphorylase family protein